MDGFSHVTYAWAECVVLYRLDVGRDHAEL